MDIWPVIHAERKSLSGDLRPLTDEQWTTASLCDGWTVRDVLAHMTSAANLTPPVFFATLIRSGFNFEKLQAKGIAAYRGDSPADTLAGFEKAQTSVKHPPGPTDTWLGEAIVHCEDIRRAAGDRAPVPDRGRVRVADFYKGSNVLIGSKNRIASLTLRATDTDWCLSTNCSRSPVPPRPWSWP